MIHWDGASGWGLIPNARRVTQFPCPRCADLASGFPDPAHRLFLSRLGARPANKSQEISAERVELAVGLGLLQ